MCVFLLDIYIYIYNQEKKFWIIQEGLFRQNSCFNSIIEGGYGILGLEWASQSTDLASAFLILSHCAPGALGSLLEVVRKKLKWDFGVPCLQPEQCPFYLAHTQYWNFTQCFVLRMSSIVKCLKTVGFGSLSLLEREENRPTWQT